MINLNGFLFIGDPHVSSKKIGRRKDNYLESVLSKLAQCAEISKEKQLLPVILGDLFHKNDDSNLKMLNQLIDVLTKFYVRPLVLEGNHDKEQTTLGDNDALSLLHKTRIIEAIMQEGLYTSYTIMGKNVNLYACPYGAIIPNAVVNEPNGFNILITHHDLAFGGSYPGATELKSITNMDMAINGHMHDTKKSVKVGATVWHNPGNIEPLSVDLAHFLPNAWEWTPNQSVDSLIPHPLKQGLDLFDLTGIQVQAQDSLEAVTQLIPESKFALELESQSTMDSQRTDDASILLEDLSYVLDTSDVSEATKLLLLKLAEDLKTDI